MGITNMSGDKIFCFYGVGMRDSKGEESRIRD